MFQSIGMANVREFDRDIRQMRDAFRSLPSAIARKYIRKAVTEATKSLRSEVRAATPKGLTGNLRKGLSTKFKYRSEGAGFFSFRVGFDRKKAPHALLVEEGTKPRYTKKGAYRGRGPARRFFKPLIERHAPSVAQRLAERLRAGLEQAMRESLP